MAPFGDASTNAWIDDLDEYTALQKYISTYRDPKLAAQDEGGETEEKPKKSWQVCCRRRRLPSPTCN